MKNRCDFHIFLMSKYKQLSTNENKKKTTTWKPFLWGACQVITHCVQQIKKKVQCFLSFDFIKISYGWECTAHGCRSYFDSVRWLNFMQHFQISKWRLQMTFAIHVIYFDKKNDLYMEQISIKLGFDYRYRFKDHRLIDHCLPCAWLLVGWNLIYFFPPTWTQYIHTNEFPSFCTINMCYARLTANTEYLI